MPAPGQFLDPFADVQVEYLVRDSPAALMVGAAVQASDQGIGERAIAPGPVLVAALAAGRLLAAAANHVLVFIPIAPAYG